MADNDKIEQKGEDASEEEEETDWDAIRRRSEELAKQNESN